MSSFVLFAPITCHGTISCYFLSSFLPYFISVKPFIRLSPHCTFIGMPSALVLSLHHHYRHLALHPSQHLISTIFLRFMFKVGQAIRNRIQINFQMHTSSLSWYLTIFASWLLFAPRLIFILAGTHLNKLFNSSYFKLLVSVPVLHVHVLQNDPFVNHFWQ